LKRQIAEAMRETAKALGNTPAVCRSSYVHPGVLDAHGSGDLHLHLARAAAREAAPGKLKPYEQAVLRLLHRIERAKAAVAEPAALSVSIMPAMASPPA
jgi:DNA topoisomerase I